MSSSLSALLSATFYERGDDHLVELIHQRDTAAHRRLHSLDVAIYDPAGKLLATPPVNPAREVLDLGALVEEIPGVPDRVMVAFDSR
jgi:hypothetical protein